MGVLGLSRPLLDEETEDASFSEFVAKRTYFCHVEVTEEVLHVVQFVHRLGSQVERQRALPIGRILFALFLRNSILTQNFM